VTAPFNTVDIRGPNVLSSPPSLPPSLPPFLYLLPLAKSTAFSFSRNKNLISLIVFSSSNT